MSNVCGFSSCGFGTKRASEKYLASDVPMYQAQSRHFLSCYVICAEISAICCHFRYFLSYSVVFCGSSVSIDHFLGTKADLKDLEIKTE